MREEVLKYVQKRIKKANADLKYDFMPEIIEIIEKPARRSGKVIIYGIFAFILFAFLWAGLSKIDIVVTAEATVVPEGNVCMVHTGLSGIIQELNVSEGAYVSKGEVLMELDQGSRESEAAHLEKQLEVLNTQNDVYALLLKNRRGDEINPDEYSASCRDAVTSIIENQKYFELKLETVKSQYGMDSVSQKLAEQEHKAELTLTIAQNNTKIDALQQELAELETDMDAMTVKAPVSGYVSGLAVNTAGSYITGTQPFLTIVPDEPQFVVECYISDSDIAEIRLNQKAAVKIAAYPYSDYGVLEGTVAGISAASTFIENKGNVYLAQIMVQNDGRFQLKSGMSATVEVQLGKRSILQYLFEPIMEGLNESLKEK